MPPINGMWWCCSCREDLNSIALQLRCGTCHHERCQKCDIESFDFLDEESERFHRFDDFNRKSYQQAEPSASNRNDSSMNNELKEYSSDEDLRALLDPESYFDDLDDLVKKAIRRLNITRFPVVGEKVIVDSTSTSIGECVHEMTRVYEAFTLLQSHGFCSSSYTLLLQDPTRSRVAVALSIGQKSLEIFFDALNSVHRITSVLDESARNEPSTRQELIATTRSALDSSQELLQLGAISSITRSKQQFEWWMAF